jgi:hypothetical protein
LEAVYPVWLEPVLRPDHVELVIVLAVFACFWSFASAVGQVG